MRTQYVLLSFLFFLSVGVNAAQKNVAPLFSYEIGIHVNDFNDDGYFDFKSTESADYDSFGLGYDLSVNYHLGNHFNDKPIFSPIFLSVGWSNFDEYESSISSACNDQNCEKLTSIKHDALMFNVHYAVLQNSIADIDIYVGVSKVFAKGKINGDGWDNNATGAQLGANFMFMQDRAIKPFLGFRLHSFEIEQGSNSARTIDISLLMGIRF